MQSFVDKYHEKGSGSIGEDNIQMDHLEIVLFVRVWLRFSSRAWCRGLLLVMLKFRSLVRN